MSSTADPAALRIVAADANAHSRSCLYRALSAHGYDVLLAADGATALALWESARPQLLILDALMPGVDGFAVCRRVRERADVPILPSVPILMISSLGELSKRVLALDDGADDYLVKPFSSEELLARVRALLRRGPGAERVLVRRHDLKLLKRQVKREQARLPARKLHEVIKIIDTMLNES